MTTDPGGLPLALTTSERLERLQDLYDSIIDGSIGVEAAIRKAAEAGMSFEKLDPESLLRQMERLQKKLAGERISDGTRKPLFQLGIIPSRPRR